MAVRRITVRATTQVRQVGRGYQVRTTVSNGKTTHIRTKTVYPR